MFKPVICFLVSCFFLVSCRDFKELECTGVSGFKVNKISTEGIDAELLLKIKNPNRIGFSIYKSEFEVTYSGVYLGKAKLQKRVHIKGNTEQVYSFNLKKNFKDVNLLDVMKLIGSSGGSNMVEVKGDLKAGKIFVKKKFPVNLKERVGFN